MPDSAGTTTRMLIRHIIRQLDQHCSSQWELSRCCQQKIQINLQLHRPSSAQKPGKGRGQAPIIIVPKGYETKINMFNAQVCGLILDLRARPDMITAYPL